VSLDAILTPLREILATFAEVHARAAALSADLNAEDRARVDAWVGQQLAETRTTTLGLVREARQLIPVMWEFAAPAPPVTVRAAADLLPLLLSPHAPYAFLPQLLDLVPRLARGPLVVHLVGQNRLTPARGLVVKPAAAEHTG